MSTCTTHHHACDCREEMFEARIDALKSENIALRKALNEAQDRLRTLQDKLWEVAEQFSYVEWFCKSGSCKEVTEDKTLWCGSCIAKDRLTHKVPNDR